MPDKSGLTPQQQKELDTILAEVHSVKSVLGSLIIGHDGSILASKMPEPYDAELVGLTALAVFKNSEKGLQELKHERLQQIVFRTQQGHITLADFGEGLLVTLTDDTKIEATAKVMRRVAEQLGTQN